MDQVVFTARLDKNDWDSEIGGWRCPALKIPGAEVTQVYASGRTVDRAMVQVTPDQIVRWIPGDPPDRINVVITLTQSLSLRSDTDFWKRLTVLVPVIVALISGTVTYLTTRLPGADSSRRVVHLTVLPIDTGAKRQFKDPIVRVNGVLLPPTPTNFSVTSPETTAIIDVTDAMNVAGALRTLATNQRDALQSIVSSSDQLVAELQKVPAIIDKNCPGGASGQNAQSNSAVIRIVEITKSTASSIGKTSAAIRETLSTPLP